MNKSTRNNILVIEDNDDDYYQAQRDFAESNVFGDLYRCVDGEDGMDFLKKEGAYKTSTTALPDLILLDLNMPKKDGYEVLKELKADDKYKKIPIVALTLYDDGNDVNKSKSLGADFCMTKPIDSNELLSLMKKITND